MATKLSTRQVSDQHKIICDEFDKILGLGGFDGYAQFRGEITLFMHYVVSNLQPQNPVRFMEIGMLMGKNFVFMGNILQKFFGPTIGIGMDATPGRKYPGYLLNLVDAIPMWQPTFDYDFILGNSHKEESKEQVRKLLEENQLDLLFIDGDHKSSGSMRDYEMYSEFVRPGGFIVYDDIHGGYDYVEKTWNTLKQQHAFIEFITMDNRCGLGILKK